MVTHTFKPHKMIQGNEEKKSCGTHCIFPECIDRNISDCVVNPTTTPNTVDKASIKTIDFRKALIMSFQIGGEKVANADTPVKTRKNGFDAIIGQTDRYDIIHASGAASWEDFTKNEQDALLYVYCKGWTIQVDNENSQLNKFK